MNRFVNFDAIKKQFILIKPLGSGGTGDTYLLKDETTEMLFAFKKYAPKDENYTDEYYQRFIDEIKILFNISHPNIVRVYNYYLYPQQKTGYLQMEYVDGQSIDQYKPNSIGNKSWSDIFKDLISAFEYLETHNILHRDIRASNIMLDKNEDVKIIDFGFGKKLNNFNIDAKSVLLNWPVTYLPNEINNDKVYNHQSEIFFLGKLLEKILNKQLGDFQFKYIIEKMIELDPNKRYTSFHEIGIDISKGVLGEINFTKQEKDIYINFADILSTSLISYQSHYSPIKDDNEILENLEGLIRSSALELFLQDNSLLINCFVKNGYVYNNRLDIEISTISTFYQFISKLSSYKRKIVLDNIESRLSLIRIETQEDDLPF